MNNSSPPNPIEAEAWKTEAERIIVSVAMDDAGLAHDLERLIADHTRLLADNARLKIAHSVEAHMNVEREAAARRLPDREAIARVIDPNTVPHESADPDDRWACALAKADAIIALMQGGQS